MEQKKKIIEVIKIIGSKLNGKKVKWLIGGSGSLLVHGLDVVPNDIDVVVDPENYNEVKTIFKDILVNGIKTDGSTMKIPFKVNDIKGDLQAYSIDNNLLTKVNIDGVIIFVHKLQVEYNFYKARTDKIDFNKKRVELIEKALLIKSKTKHFN